MKGKIMMRPIFVIGTGRCGTSTVARILHDHFGICMGKRFRDPDEYNEKGYFEDLDLKSLNEELLSGRLMFPAWYNSISNELAKPWRQKENWGFKDPRLSELFGLYLSFVESPFIIYCTRNKDDTVKSIQKCYGWSASDASSFFNRRKKMIDNVLDLLGVDVEIHFNQKKTDDEIIEELQYLGVHYA